MNNHTISKHSKQECLCMGETFIIVNMQSVCICSRCKVKQCVSVDVYKNNQVSFITKKICSSRVQIHSTLTITWSRAAVEVWGFWKDKREDQGSHAEGNQDEVDIASIKTTCRYVQWQSMWRIGSSVESSLVVSKIGGVSPKYKTNLGWK